MENSNASNDKLQTKNEQRFKLKYNINSENDSNQNVPVYLEFKSDGIYSYASEPKRQLMSCEENGETKCKSSSERDSPDENRVTATGLTFQGVLQGRRGRKAYQASLQCVSTDTNEGLATNSTFQSVSSGRSGGTASKFGKGGVGTNSMVDKNVFYSNNQYCPDVVTNLRVSTVSVGTTYDQIEEPEEKHVKKSPCSLERLFVILTLAVIIIAGCVLLYIFIINKSEHQSGSGCNSIPAVRNGQVSHSDLAQESGTVTVTCKDGFRIHGNETMICENDVWTTRPECVPVKCGVLPTIEHGIVNGTSDDFNTSANVVCDNGFFLENIETISCQADGNWSTPPSCLQHPCGNYTLEEGLLFIQDSGASYLTLCFKCKPGMTFSNESDHCVSCKEGTWEGRPECEVQGAIKFYPHQVYYNADDKVSLTCSLSDSPNWQSVGLARSDFSGSYVEPLYNIQNTAGNIEVKRLSNTSISNVTYTTDDHGVTLVLTIVSAHCKDSGIYICGNIIGNIDAPDNVKITNTSVYVRAHADVPDWIQFPDDIISGSNELFKCSAEIGDPKGYIDVESNFDGNFSILFTTRSTHDSNDIGNINYFTDEESECGNSRLVVFSLKNVTSMYHQKELRCVSRNFEYPLNAKSAASETRPLQVLPDDFCRMDDTVKRHPYDCGRFVLCSLGKVAGIPAGCADNYCFNNDDNTCYPCDQLGGCSITDIFIDGYNGWIREGNSATLICIVKDFEGLTDIRIAKGNSSVIWKLSDQQTETGISYITEQSFINGTSGKLTYRIDSVQCKDEGEYHCSPIGLGKYSEDETNLALRDASGNILC